MNLMLVITLLFVIVFSTGCTATGQSFRALSIEEAFSFEKTIQTRPFHSDKKPNLLLIQPLNKEEACKLPANKIQLERTNSKIYWDGQCKNGYAFGFGREISISDTHHVDKVTTHNGMGDDFESNSATYDYINKRVIYRHSDGEYPKATILEETVLDDGVNFSVVNQMRVIANDQKIFGVDFSPLSSSRYYIYKNKNIIYRYSDYSQVPPVDPGQFYSSVEVLDPLTMTPGGVMLIKYINGQVRHLQFGSGAPEIVIAPVEYLNFHSEKHLEVSNAVPIANLKFQQIRKMEREYLFMTCNEKYFIIGLDDNTAKKICTWRDKLKVSFELAAAKYKTNMEELQRKAEINAAQRQAEQQLAIEKSKLEALQSHQAATDFINALNGIGQQMLYSGSQALNNTMQLRSPQFPTFGLPSRGRINCIGMDSFISCR